MRKATKNAEKFPDTDEHGHEIMDPVPMAPPVGFKKPVSMADRVRELVLAEHRRLSSLQEEFDTPEEGDDFDVGDDMDPSTPYEEEFDPLSYTARNELRQAEFRAQVEARKELLSPQKKEKDNGNGNSNKGRMEDRRERPGKSGEVRESDASSDEQSDDGGSKPKVAVRPKSAKD